MDIQVGDTVRCKVDYYRSYNRNQIAIVKRVEGHLIILPNPYTMYGESSYSSDNWEFVSRPKKKDNIMKQNGYVKTKYFGMQVQRYETGEINGFINPMPLRDTRDEAIKDIQSVIQEGQEWTILETKGFITLVPPTPPLPEIQLTVCK